jgi:hypothetical protein
MRWEELRQQDKTLTAEELCPDDTQLQALLRDRLARRQRLHAIVDLPTVARHKPVAKPAALPVIDGYEIGELVGRAAWAWCSRPGRRRSGGPSHLRSSSPAATPVLPAGGPGALRSPPHAARVGIAHVN